MSTTIKEILTEARRLLNDVGFCKGRLKYTGEDGHVLAYCVMGAIDEACTRLCVGDSYPRISECQKTLRLAIGEDVNIPQWNDETDRSKSDVLSAFSKAIDSCS